MTDQTMEEKWNTEEDEPVFIIKPDGSEWEIMPNGEQKQVIKQNEEMES